MTILQDVRTAFYAKYSNFALKQGVGVHSVIAERQAAGFGMASARRLKCDAKPAKFPTRTLDGGMAERLKALVC